MRASIAAETAGFASVSILCRGFEGQAAATARGHGFDELALAVTTGHVDAQSTEQMLRDFLGHTVEQIVAGLTDPAPSDLASNANDRSGAAPAEPAASEIAMVGTIDEINRGFVDRGWSDGSPIIPPTRSRVEAFIEPSGHDPWKRLGVATSSGRDITIWSIAVNAVMAGCRPEDLPVLIAAAEVLADPGYGMEHSGNTTGADALMIVNGPVVNDLGFNHGPGALRDGAAVNTTIGRWLRLYLRNVGGFTADEHDKATFGNTYRVVLAEDETALADIGWEPLSADFGFARGDDVLTMARLNSGAIIGSVFGSTPPQIVPYLADGLARIGGWDLTHNHGLGHHQFRPLLVLSPILARTFAAAGWSKSDVRRALFEQARIPAWRYEKLIGEWSNLSAGRPRLVDVVAAGDLPAAFAESEDPDRPVPIVVDPAHIMIAVAGDPNRTNAYVFSNDGPHGDYTSKPIDRRPSVDLVCLVEP